MDFIITWSNGVGRVGTSQYLYDVIEKPSLDFAFDSLYYETATALYIKVLKGTQYTLTDSEKRVCAKYCDDFKNSDEYMIYAYDPDLLIFKGFMPRGKATAAGYHEAVDATMPDHIMSKWVNGSWKRIVAAIDETGRLYLLPSNDRLIYNFFFTDEEWKAFPKPTYDDEIFDFKTNTWKDNRSLDSSKALAEEKIRADFLKHLSKYNLVHYESDPVMYMIQIREIDNPNGEHPFLDAMAKEMKVSVEDVITRVKRHYSSELLTELGSIHGKMYASIDGVRNASSLSELDSIMLPLFKDTNYPWRRPMRIDPYASSSKNN